SRRQEVARAAPVLRPTNLGAGVGPGGSSARPGRPLLVFVVAGVLDHVAARPGAVTARLGTAFHVLVVLGLLTRLGAVVADLGAPLTGRDCTRPLAGNDLGGQGTEVAAVGAQRHGAGVLLLPLADQVGAVLRARLALQQARRTLLGALVEVVVLLVVAGGAAHHLAASLGLGLRLAAAAASLLRRGVTAALGLGLAGRAAVALDGAAAVARHAAAGLAGRLRLGGRRGGPRGPDRDQGQRQGDGNLGTHHRSPKGRCR